jgi:hypothetical protein
VCMAVIERSKFNVQGLRFDAEDLQTKRGRDWGVRTA